ncbi:FIG00926764: hypothetical protein [hydrothermal vent metagenome]|uniref:EF-hand domain-containing protein n=1 Tax=hydrothermal vent metagenome TaxID=652676 RepID=A0A3B1E537_9ZZZZ
MQSQKQKTVLKSHFLQSVAGIALLLLLPEVTMAAKYSATSSSKVTAQVDRTIEKELRKSKTPLSSITSDEDFLRRVTFDLIGTTPSANEVTLFGLNPDSKKRAKLIERLLADEAYAKNWAGYWREVIFSRATDPRSRIAQNTFNEWMATQLHENKKWNEIVTAMVTATGNVQENGETAIIFAHQAQAPEIAAEMSRIFMGVQVQCANCHDHPTDRWTRKDFHQLAAYFPRMRIARAPKKTGQRRSFAVTSVNTTRKRRNFTPKQILRRFDKNNDKKVSLKEVKGTRFARLFNRILRNSDKNKDKKLSLKELKSMPKPNNNRPRGSAEYYMPNLKEPSSKGTQMEPVFFINKTETQSGLKDLDRRGEFAELLTSRNNPWFAKAFVNRVWHEMLGEGFYMPVDDIGPERHAKFPKALELLATGFITNNYDIKWLYRTIANTQTYQRSLRARDAGDLSLPFAAATPTRLRSDQLFNALTKVLGADEVQATGRGRGRSSYQRSAKGRFAALFGFDPSTPQEDILGNVPQALFMMNSDFINSMITTQRDTRLARILKRYKNDDDAANELYLMVLAREPSQKEKQIFKTYRKKITNREEAYEDLMWSLLNSSEFISKR